MTHPTEPHAVEIDLASSAALIQVTELPFDEVIELTGFAEPIDRAVFACAANQPDYDEHAKS